MSVKVTRMVYDQLKEVMDAGLINMSDARAVAQELKKRTYRRAAQWVMGNPRRYREALSEGMVVC